MKKNQLFSKLFIAYILLLSLLSQRLTLHTVVYENIIKTLRLDTFFYGRFTPLGLAVKFYPYLDEALRFTAN